MKNDSLTHLGLQTAANCQLHKKEKKPVSKKKGFPRGHYSKDCWKSQELKQAEESHLTRNLSYILTWQSLLQKVKGDLT